MNPDELCSRIAAFPVWHYQFNFDGITTPIRDEAAIIRHEKRERYFFDTLVRLCGGSLNGRRVLDLGCNAGWWSLKAIEAGCDFVAGIDGRQMHIDQANLIFEAKRVDPARYQFTVGNVVASPWPAGDFDVVLCLGLLYHISKPMELMERISYVNNDLLVVDTEIIDVGGSYWRSQRESLKDPSHAVDFETGADPLPPGGDRLGRTVRLHRGAAGTEHDQMPRRHRLSPGHAPGVHVRQTHRPQQPGARSRRFTIGPPWCPAAKVTAYRPAVSTCALTVRSR